MIEQVLQLVRAAGELVMEVYRSDFAAHAKADASPVTEADTRAESLIVAGLRALDSSIPIVAEEAFARGDRPATSSRFWLVDPLDGTREFVDRNGEFTVNVALIENGLPVLGVVGAPAIGKRGRLFWGVPGQGAFVEDEGQRRAMFCRAVPDAGLTVLASRSHGDAPALARFLAGRQVAATTYAGSSLKLCLIADGQADIYPRFGRTMEWDIAAGHAVLAAAGGQINLLSGAALTYGKPGFENPHFVAQGAQGKPRHSAVQVPS